MGSSKTGRRHHYEAHQRKADTRKIVGRITYNPVKHKQHKVRTLRRKLQEKNIPSTPPAIAPPKKLKFGSFNIDGLDIEAAWAIDKLVKERGFDVIMKKNAPQYLIRIILGSGSERNSLPCRSARQS